MSIDADSQKNRRKAPKQFHNPGKHPRLNDLIFNMRNMFVKIITKEFLLGTKNSYFLFNRSFIYNYNKKGVFL